MCNLYSVTKGHQSIRELYRVAAMGFTAMVAERAVRQKALFYGFDLYEHVPADYLLRSIDASSAGIPDRCNTIGDVGNCFQA